MGRVCNETELNDFNGFDTSNISNISNKLEELNEFVDKETKILQNSVKDNMNSNVTNEFMKHCDDMIKTFYRTIVVYKLQNETLENKMNPQIENIMLGAVMMMEKLYEKVKEADKS